MVPCVFSVGTAKKYTNLATLITVAALVSTTIGASSAAASVRPRGNEINISYPVLAKEASNILKGHRFVHYACIFQFDSVTGTKDFLAEWTNSGYGIWNDVVNVRLPSASVGAKAFATDVVALHGYVLGNLSYQTQSGGNDTVPNLEVTTIAVVGHNCS
jgi:hypothetical protein